MGAMIYVCSVDAIFICAIRDMQARLAGATSGRRARGEPDRAGLEACLSTCLRLCRLCLLLIKKVYNFVLTPLPLSRLPSPLPFFRIDNRSPAATD